MLDTHEKILRVYVHEHSVHYNEDLKVHTANGYRLLGATTPYPYVELSDIPLLEQLWPDLDEIKKSLVYEAIFEKDGKELNLGWFSLDKGETRALLEKTKKNLYHLYVESPQLKKLIRAISNIKCGTIKPQ